jgi:putative transposase
MRARKTNAEEYIQFLLGTQLSFSAVEQSRVRPIEREASHDSVTRFLNREEEGARELWEEVKGEVLSKEGALIIDDSTLDKPYTEKMDLVTHHWSGKHHRVVEGINLVSLLWTDGDRHVPCDYHVFEAGKETKNQLFCALLKTAYSRGIKPQYVLFDSWYSSAENLRVISMDYQWKYLTRLKSNRKVRDTGTYHGVDCYAEGRHRVWLKRRRGSSAVCCHLTR